MNQKTHLWGMAEQVAHMLEQRAEPILTAWDLFHRMRVLFHEAEREVPPPAKLYRNLHVLLDRRILAPDRDYSAHYRVVAVPDQPADDVVCLIDRFACISHLSAMQRWGLTDRQPHALMITRPDAGTVRKKLAEIVTSEAAEIPWKDRPRQPRPGPFRLGNIVHPSHVRERPVRMHVSQRACSMVRDRNSFARVTSIGQTFLDMLQTPRLCGGMSHTLEAWDEHADSFLDEIIRAVDGCGSVITKCRAGYILEERLGVTDRRVEAWKSGAARGGSRRLDPARPYAPKWSENWMISINA